MGNWGISDDATEKEKLKSEYADYLGGLNSCGEIPYTVYSEAFDMGMDLLERMYELGKSDAITDCGYWEREAKKWCDKLFDVRQLVEGVDHERSKG